MTLKKVREGLMVITIVTLGIMVVNLTNDLRQMNKLVSDLEVNIDTMQDVTVDHEYVIDELLKGGE
jgi:hypothetical protein